MKVMRSGSRAGKLKSSIWKYLRNYKFNSLVFRYFLIIVLLVVIPSGLLSILYSRNTNQVLQQEISDANLNSLHRSSSMIENVMIELNGFAYNLSVSQDCLSFVYSNKQSVEFFNLAGKINETIKFLTNTYDYIDSIYIYSETQGLIIDGRTISSMDAITDKTWLSTYQGMGESKFVVESRRKNDNYPYYITLICPIHAGRTQTVGAVVVNVNIEGVGKLIGNNKDATQQLYIIDDSMRLYYSSDLKILDHDDAKADFLSFLGKRGGDISEVVKLDGEEMIISSVDSKRYAWRYVLLSPLSLYQKKLDDINKFMLSVTIAASVLSLLSAYYLTIKTFEPVRRIIGVVDNPTPFTEEATDAGKDSDEIQHITSLVRNTQVMNSRLSMELEERLEMLNKAQLRALQGQIDPHFLYNTLDTIHWMAYEELGDDNKVSQMIITLAQLLRVNLQRSGYLVNVREEVEHAKLYVRILELRYKDRLRVQWRIDDDILDCGIIKLAIQPLVENALQHGLKSRRYQGSIVISGRREDESIAISVEDDGVGLSAEDIAALNEHLTNNYEMDDAHIGIRNVNQRIKILFGELYGVRMASRSGGGLIVTIVVPWGRTGTD
jgi:two-component system, sensor histidine kinase YesM